MTPTHLSFFDAFLSLLAAMGLFPVIKYLMRADYLIPLERILKWALLFLFSMMLLRIPVFAFHNLSFSPWVYVFAQLIIFSFCIYFEILLRRHFPLWFKILIALGTIIFIVDASVGNLSHSIQHLIVFGGYLSIVALVVGFICLTRKRSDYTRIENPIIDLNIFAVFIMAPLLLTDITTYRVEGLPRFGVLGILLFAYVAIYNQALYHGRRHIMAKLFKALLFSLLLTVASVYLVQDWSLQITGRLFTLFFSINLIFRINYAVKQLEGEEDFFGFVKAINSAEKDSLFHFLRNIDGFFGRLDKKVLRRADLVLYDVVGISTLFKKNSTHLLNILDIKDILSSPEQLTSLKSGEIELLEQIVDILEKNEMSYICKFGQKNPLFVLFHVPIFGYRQMIDLKTSLISEVSALIEGTSELKTTKESSDIL